MTKDRRSRRDGASLRQLATCDGACPAGSEAARTVAAREAEVLAREVAADLREATVDLREHAADSREEAADLREAISTPRERTLRAQEGAARSAARNCRWTGALLRQANEQLVVATVEAQSMTEMAEQTSARMTYVAAHDALTGLPNRALMADRLAQAIALAERHGEKVALMYLDLDHFKRINDTLGHSVGDQVLQSAAERLLKCVRLSDTVCRQGGDEFVVVLTEVRAVRDAALAAEKLGKAFEEPHLIGELQLDVGLSIGVSLYPDDGADGEAMLRNADTAMYHAKKNGRNRYQVFDKKMSRPGPTELAAALLRSN